MAPKSFSDSDSDYLSAVGAGVNKGCRYTGNSDFEGDKGSVNGGGAGGPGGGNVGFGGNESRGPELCDPVVAVDGCTGSQG